jgi:fusaric acid resistance family protein
MRDVMSAEPDAGRRAADQPSPSAPQRWLPQWWDRLLGSDPGLTRLRMALQAVVTIGVAMAAEWLFVRLTGALRTAIPESASPAQVAQVAAVNHGLLVVAIILGAVVGMMASFGGGMFAGLRAQLVGFALLPVEMIAGLAVGLAVGGYRVPALVSLVVVLAGGTYCRRFGPAGFLGGMVTFMGVFFGFFLHGELAVHDLGWLSAQIGVGMLVAVAAQYTLFHPGRRAALRRMLRSYTARARDVAGRSAELFDQPARGGRARAGRRLRHRLVRLNEAALMIDARLADPVALPAGWSAPLLHQAVFDAELALTNVARFTQRLAEVPLPLSTRRLVRDALGGVAARDLARADAAARALCADLERLREAVRPDVGDTPPHWTGAPETGRAAAAPSASDLIVAHRFATSVTGLVAAAHAWLRAAPDRPTRSQPWPARAGELAELDALESEFARTGTDDDEDREQAGSFEASVELFGGWLPGSATVSADASKDPEAGQGFWDRVRLAPYTRVAIQMGVAVTGAILLGEVLSERRFYWALLAAFVTFMGANNAGEQLRKGFHRVVGTVVGVLLGALGAHLVANHTAAAIAVILASLFVGLYLMRISYAFMVIGITIMVSQLYVQLDEYSNALLLLRLEETALGAAVAAVTVLCVFPLRTGRVARLAARRYVQGAADLAEQAIARLLDRSEPGPAGSDVALRKAARDLDAAYQTLLATLAALRLPFTMASDRSGTQVLHAVTAARHYARNLVIDTTDPMPLTPTQRHDLRVAAAQLAASLTRLATPPAGTDDAYVRSAALFDLVVTREAGHDENRWAGPSPLTLAMRDLQLLDGAMAALAETAGRPVRALDTTALLDSSPPAA